MAPCRLQQMVGRPPPVLDVCACMSRYIVGVTGGIGSGKTTLADALAQKGACVVDTDQIAHALTAPHGQAIAQIKAAFGGEVIDAHGALDRAAMRRRVFAAPAERQRLESILHPLIRAESLRRCVQAESPYVLLLIPLLAETRAGSAYAFLDRVLVVDCDEATQISRVMRRNGMNEAEVRAILSAQVSRAERNALADDVVLNNGAWESMGPHLDELHERYLRLAAEKVKASC